VSRGLLVIGADLAADACGTAAQLADALRTAGEDPAEVAAIALAGDRAGRAVAAVHALAGRATPHTAAAHEGARIDPGALVSRVREAIGARTAVVSAAGGLLAPLTVRYSTRDLARELELPVVLAVSAAPDLVNVARLSLESARAAGIAVAAIVLTGWPDPPNRVLLDERRLLETVAPVPVLTRPGERGWDARAWLDARPAGPRAEVAAVAAAAAAAEGAETAPAARGEIALDPYRAWEPQPAGDPRETPRPRIMAAIEAIVEAEGPMRASRAYALYNRAAGGRKLTTIARAPLSSAAYWLAREERLVLTPADSIPWQDDDLLRTPDTPAVHVRELGPRTLEEVPLDEIAELMRRLAATGASGEAALKRGVLQAYGLARLTTRADEYLGLACGLLAQD
jgi:dethiobiotin synthetase